MRKLLRAFWRIITIPFRIIFWLLSTSELRAALSSIEEEDSPLPDVIEKVVENPAGMLEHLNALRKHLFRALFVLALATGLSLAFNPQVMAFLAFPLEGGMESLVAIEVTEPIGTVMRVSLLSGFAISFPYIIYQLWLFVAPAIIERRNRWFSFLSIPIVVLFFLGGMAFAYFVMLPTALPFLLNFMGINTVPRPSSYIRFATGLMFWIGIAFEFPLVIFLLAKLGWVKAEMLAQQWRLAIVIIAVIAALITPTIDPVNMSLVMGPLIILYFLSILLAKIAQRGRTQDLPLSS